MKKPTKMYRRDGKLTKAGIAYKASKRASGRKRVKSGPNEGRFVKASATRRKSRKSAASGRKKGFRRILSKLK